MDIKRTIRLLAREYPADLVAVQLSDIDRIAFHIELVLERTGRGSTVCDIGGGIGMFSLACAALGMEAILIDDFNDPVNLRYGDSVLDLHRSHGVQVTMRDALEEGLELAPQSLDAATSFDSMEHWHCSPKDLFRSVVSALRPGGLFILGAPNCVHLRKRLTVPLGYGKWSQMHDWYEQKVFRGHVREPDVGDLLYIAGDLDLRDVRVLGRNWVGHTSSRASIRLATKVVDRLLRLRPTLCSDLYLLGHSRKG